MIRLIRIGLLLLSLIGGVLLGGALRDVGMPWLIFIVPLGAYAIIYRRQENHWPHWGFFSQDVYEVMHRYPVGSPPPRRKL